MAPQCSHYRPGRSDAAAGEQLQELWDGFASALKVVPITVAIEAQQIVHAPAQFEVQGPNHLARCRAIHRLAIVTRWPANGVDHGMVQIASSIGSSIGAIRRANGVLIL